jgi:hypothetical protein
MNLAKGFGPIVSLMLTPNGPFAFENIAMPNDLDEDVKIEREVLKVQLILNFKTWVFHYRLSLP